MISTKKFLFAVVLSAISLPSCFAQAKAAHPATAPDPDRLGQTCPQILKMGSGDWVSYFVDKTGLVAVDNPSGANPPRHRRLYGKCYDERTSHLAAALGKSGKGPLDGNARTGTSATSKKRWMISISKRSPAPKPPKILRKPRMSASTKSSFATSSTRAMPRKIFLPARSLPRNSTK